MLISENRGISLKAGSELFVDASGIRNKNALITHAHSDHAKTSASNTYYLTPETASLIRADSLKCAVKKIDFGKKFSVDGFECSFRPNGHILGSAQLEVVNGQSAVITSDFKLQKSILFDGAEILQGDTLVIETTFGLPEYSFPSREKVYEDMIKWIGSNLSKKRFVVLGGYSTGKAQELTKVVNEFLGEAPLVHKRVFEQNKVYESHGVKLGDYIALDHNLADSNILIMPPHLINDSLLLALQHQLGRQVELAIATGWRSSSYKTFPLSDHADFSSLVKYVKECNPKLVLTTHGFTREFASHVSRRLGIPAKPLSEARQTMLGEFGAVNS